MKTAIVKVPFFINENNMQYLLKGYIIDNLDEVYSTLLFKNGTDIYEARENDLGIPVSYKEYPNQSDVIKAKAIRYLEENGIRYLEIELIDSLYYHRLKEPVIKLNGYCTVNFNEKLCSDVIHIENITRITLADRQAKFVDIL